MSLQCWPCLGGGGVGAAVMVRWFPVAAGFLIPRPTAIYPLPPDA